ncbi:ABC transporter ATP-binding protein [Pseudomarimonas salicorniae]|uniref:ATP-binding cassette domain-containing protein n=1 Tax=Pseudomarimonas salicorniae TaxID=2933270 RepID=A0ABT0GLL0_9GAMM|nr:ATP-binding cassette domain-containing protein [Lysobacter sp. CAU 1642]MCK7595432.1 ATP-binding cassette domain-containing protein [Lysobacter sp. CAU 1642]
MAIRLTDLHKSFGPKQAVRGIDLEVPRGALYGIIGPNGAGKSTTLRMILSILFPDAGEIEVLGCRSALAAKDRIGYLPEERGVYRKMSVGDFLRHMAQLKGVPRGDCARRIGHWLERVALADVARKKCEELSKGMQQKVQFIASVIHEPELLILDEPFSGLDPVAMRLLRDLILEQHRRGTTVLFSTHVMFQAEQLCEHIVMIHDGRKVLDDSLAGIRDRHAPRAFLIEPLAAIDDAAARLQALPGVQAVAESGRGWRVDLSEQADPATVLPQAAATLPPARLELIQPTLEDIFIGIAGRPATTEVEA